ncbi:Spy/CpxP family protein refolding chaperone [Sunxiuqinia sp. A32]|uniref:Spy/CpxP family protein refolding chaperone n=1 Tax=Sunxiuqinia sp. A32 TaxID=3461496 RepID=UPI00404554AF
MKLTGILLFVLLVVSQISYAQSEQGQRMSQEQRNEMMAKNLGLDDAQKAKFEKINAKYQEKTSGFREKMRSATDEERRELFAEMREIRNAQNKEIKEILTDEQKQKFDQMQKEREQRWQNRGNGERRGGNPRNGDVRPGK